ncbi:MAG TPA: AAA family ATPase [Ktedonobacteraceae bacterium]
MLEAFDGLKVTTLGRFAVLRNQDALSGGYWNRRRVCELFKILLSVEQHRMHREQVQELLWPDSSMEQAANSFGKTLYLLRRALEPELSAGKSSAYLALDQDVLVLVLARFEIDIDLFEQQARLIQTHAPDALRDFDAVLALYGGDYLPDDLYEDWTQRRRDRLRRTYSWLLEQAARVAINTAQGQRASEYLRALLEQNSLDEAMHRELMLVYARTGRRSEALSQYQAMRKILHDELNTTPAPETVELYSAILEGRITPDLVDFRQPFTPQSVLELSGSLVHTHTHAASDLHASSHETHEVAVAPGGQQAVRASVIPDMELVGRNRELQRLQQAFTNTRNEQHWIFFVSGEAGIGKTRLARELSSWVEDQRTTTLWCTCDELSNSLPYQPIVDMLSTHIRASSPERVRAVLGQSAVDLAKILPELRMLFPELPLPEPFGREVERRNLFNAVSVYLNTLATEGRLLLVLDDLQWVDSATIQLLSYVLQQNASQNVQGSQGSQRNARLFVLLLYRADEVHETHPLRTLLGTQLRTGHAEELRLKRLKEDEVQQLLIQMAGHEVSINFTEEIYKHTEGNPFFIGESIRTLVEEGKLKKSGERWQTTIALKDLALPQSVRMLIERRLTNLSPECRLTLAYAALLGRQFHSSLLCPARHLSEEKIAEHVDEALHMHILTTPAEEMFSQDVDLLFTHDKIREVLALWLNPLRRRTAHAQIAQAIETHYASHLSTFYSAIAHHYQMAEERTKAVAYLQKAAGQAMSVYAFAEAASLLEKMLELLIGTEQRFQRAEVLRKLSIDAYLYTGQATKAIEAGIAACSLWQELGEPIKEAESRLDVSFSFHWMGKEQESLTYIKRALECLNRAPEELRLRARAHVQWGLAATNSGDTLKALGELQLADELHARIGDKDPFISVVSLWARSWCAFACGTQEEMLDYALRSAELCRTIHMFAWEPMMTYSAAWAMMLMGRLAEAARIAHETYARALRHNSVGAQGWANLVLSFIAIQQQDWDEAERYAQETAKLAAMMHDTDLLARSFWGRSICAGWQGDWQRSVDQSLEALRILEQEGEISLLYPYLLLQAAKAHFYAGLLAQAQEYLEQTMKFAEERHYRQLPAIGRRMQGRILQAQEQFVPALACFKQSQTELAALHDEVEYARTQEAYGLYFHARNQAGDQLLGDELLREARAIFTRLGIKG